MESRQEELFYYPSGKVALKELMEWLEFESFLTIRNEELCVCIKRGGKAFYLDESLQLVELETATNNILPLSDDQLITWLHEEKNILE